MAIRTKPLSQHHEREVTAIINKGGGTGQEDKNQDPYRLTLRIPRPLKAQVDEIIQHDPVQPTLTAWILEAMKKKVQSDDMALRRLNEKG